MTTIRHAGPQFPLIHGWRDVRDVGKKRGWAWPPYVTVHRRWTALPVADRHLARHGREDAAGRFAMPVIRDKTSISPLQWVSLDDRTLDVRVDFGDGKAVRPIMIALVDVASNMIICYELTRAQNAVSTVRVIAKACETYDIFDRLYTDNGSAFAGHLVAGGNVFRFRNAGSKLAGVKPLGVCFHLGIHLHFALPTNAQAKIIERIFADLSRLRHL